MDAVVHVEAVERAQTRNGNTRFVLRDSEGNVYTTFRPEIGEAAERHAGARARIEYHEQQRGSFRNVYLDAVAAAGEEEGRPPSDDDSSSDEAAWRTAVDAAPWLVGSRDPEGEVPPDELFEKLKPFKDRVAEDIEDEAEGEE